MADALAATEDEVTAKVAACLDVAVADVAIDEAVAARVDWAAEDVAEALAARDEDVTASEPLRLDAAEAATVTELPVAARVPTCLVVAEALLVTDEAVTERVA